MFRCNVWCCVKMVHLYVIYLIVHLSIVASKSSQNSLVSFIRIANVNKEMNIDIFCCCRDVVRKKHPKNWRNNSWFLPPEAMLQHTGRFQSRFLHKERSETSLT